MLKSKRVYKKNMKGGEYTQEQTQQLINAGFNNTFLKVVDSAKVGFNILWNNFQSSNLTPQQYMDQTYNDLNMNPDDGITDNEEDDDDQEGGKKNNKQSRKNKTRKNKTKKNKTQKNKTKKNKTQKNKKQKNKKQIHSKKSNTLKGGMVYGNGYGANCNDPNYSIYNTNLLKLFPYNPK
jgi:hypothetical protein